MVSWSKNMLGNKLVRQAAARRNKAGRQSITKQIGGQPVNYLPQVT
jgi:hypothetical protein